MDDRHPAIARNGSRALLERENHINPRREVQLEPERMHRERMPPAARTIEDLLGEFSVEDLRNSGGQ